jgi:hypothetical protein
MLSSLTLAGDRLCQTTDKFVLVANMTDGVVVRRKFILVVRKVVCVRRESLVVLKIEQESCLDIGILSTFLDAIGYNLPIMSADQVNGSKVIVRV